MKNDYRKITKFISYRLFEVVCILIIVPLMSIFVVPVLVLLFSFLIPNINSEQLESVWLKLMTILIIGLVLYWWYKVFQNKEDNYIFSESWGKDKINK